MNKRVVREREVLATVLIEPGFDNAENVGLVKVQLMVDDTSSFVAIRRSSINEPNRKRSCRSTST